MKLRDAALDPAAMFVSPQAVRDSGELTLSQKIEILKRWAYDAAEADVAAEEGMPEGGAADVQREILCVLAELTEDVDFEHSGPTKQHGLPLGLTEADESSDDSR